MVKHSRVLVKGIRGCREKMTKEYYWIGAEENKGMFTKSGND